MLAGSFLGTAALAQQQDMTGWSGVIQHEYMSSDERTTSGSLTGLKGMRVMQGEGFEQTTYLLRTTYMIQDGQVQASHLVRSDQRSSSSSSMIYACTLEELFVHPRWVSGSSEQTTTERVQGSGPGDCTIELDAAEPGETEGMVIVNCSSEAKATANYQTSSSETCSGCCEDPPGTPSFKASPGTSSSSEEDIPALGAQQAFPKGKVPRSFSGSTRTENDDKKGHHTTSWTLWRSDVDDVVEVEPADYDAWRPTGSDKETERGNTLLVRAVLRKRSGKPTDVRAQRFEFKLIQRSFEPGTMMNWPPPPERKLDEPDLRFDADLNAKLDLEVSGDRGDKAMNKDGSYEEATAKVSSYDWGAYGVLTVEAVLPDGERLLGHLFKDESKRQILIPKRSGPDDPIAEAWRRQHDVLGIDARDDSDKLPAGDGDDGDGLSLYEEYRGFRVNKRHISTDPKKKDLFVVNDVGARAKQGIVQFGAVTGLDVHSTLQPDELWFRGINWNSSGAFRNQPQHGVVVENAPPSQTDYSNAAFPTVPGATLYVKMISDVDHKLAGTEYERTVMHELGHTCNLYHHGDSDIGSVRWSLDGGKILEEKRIPNTDKYLPGKTPITVYDDERLLGPPPGIVLPKPRWWIGTTHGQHSGVEDCLMRYDMADTVRPSERPDSRYQLWSNEKSGMTFCSSPAGTGVNASSQKPEPRYGDAQPRRGNCIGQLCVNDGKIGTHAAR